ncbi:MAG: T9SS type A sorting domain-containing protein [Candidatus Eisenbacteria bacterium]|nr:T9SS type A sorting domain-containing protein [Candidatus Eisenbacteria bacterium]
MNGAIEAWGANDHGQCNVPSPNSGFVAVGAGHAHSVGLKGDGSVVAWGLNLDHQCEVPSSSTDFIALAVGFYHNLALSRDGSIVAWGSNAHGECEVPEPNVDFVAVSAGHWHSVGLKSDGMVVAWGYNVYGQCDVPPPNTEFVGLASGVYHNLRLRHIPTGRCCHLDGSCSITTQPECHSAGDSWNGAETDCDPNPCPMPAGACCLNAFCTQLTADECQGYGGTYQGDGVVCVTDICITSAVEPGSVDNKHRAAPNPSAGTTTIFFSLAQPGWISVRIHDAGGRLVRTLSPGAQRAGAGSLIWDGRDDGGHDVPSGVYLYTIETDGVPVSGRVVVTR